MNKKDLGLLILILVVGAAVAIQNPLFLSPINLANTANLIGLFGIFAIGQAFVIITGGIDLSVGSVIALLGVAFIVMLAKLGVPWPLAILAMIIAGAALGLLHGLLITQIGIQPFIVTLCGLLIYRGIARASTGDGTAGFNFGQRFETLEYLTQGRLWGIPNSFIAMLVIGAIMWVLLHRSVFGRYLFAVGRNEEAARFSGIPTKKVIVAAYVLSGALGGLAAVYFAMYTKSVQPSSHANFYELYAIAAAVLGGCSLRGGEGSIVGVILGAMLLQVLKNLVNLLGIPSSLDFAVTGSVILLGVLADTWYNSYRRSKLAREAAAGSQSQS